MRQEKRRVFAALLFCLGAFRPCHGQTVVLPDACGADKVKFNIGLMGGKNPPPVADPAKAQIVFINTAEGPELVQGNTTTRVGVDGAWVGANQENSFFVVKLDPGVHHLCVVWKKTPLVGTIKAEGGMIYYYEAKITTTAEQLGYSRHPNLQVDHGFKFTQLTEDEALYRIKVSLLSTATPKK
jgi:hypothetical protein